MVFFLSIISSYASHFKKLGNVRMIVPALNALSSTMILYFMAFLFTELNRSLGIDFIETAARSVMDNIMLVLAALICLGYLFFMAERSS
jgi:hypothetical protein